MLSVIVDARENGRRLAGALVQLTPAAVEGLAREVIAVAMRDFHEAEALCEEMGALIDHDLWCAMGRAKSDWLLVVPAEARFAEGWVERLREHLAAGPKPARLEGLRTGGLFAARPEGVLIERQRAAGVKRPDLNRLRGSLGVGAPRIG